MAKIGALLTWPGEAQGVALVVQKACGGVASAVAVQRMDALKGCIEFSQFPRSAGC